MEYIKVGNKSKIRLGDQTDQGFLVDRGTDRPLIYRTPIIRRK